MASKKELKALITLAGKVDPSLQAALLKASKETEKTSGKLSKLGSLAAKGLQAMGKAALAVGKATVAGIGAGTVALAGLAMKASEDADSLLKLRDKTGLTAEELQRLRHIASQVGADFESIPQAISILTKQMDAARKGSKDAEAAFKALGIQITDSAGNLRPQSQVFQEAIIQLSKIESEADRNALAFRLFGRGAASLFPILNAGTEEIQALAAEADRLGLVLSEETVEGLDNMGDTVEKMKNAFQGLGNRLIGQLLPKIQPLLDSIIDRLPSITQMLADIGGGFLGGIADLLPQMLSMAGQLMPIVTDGLRLISRTLGPMILDALQQALPIVMEVAQIALPLMVEGFRMFLSIIQPLLPPLMQIVQQLLPIAAVLMQTVFAILAPFMPLISQLVEAILPPVLQILQAILPLVEALAPILTAIANVISKVLGKAIEWITPLLKWLGEVIATIVNGIGKFISGIGNLLGLNGKKVNLQANLAGSLPKYAEGGFSNRPAIFGDDGLEVAIPIERTPRSLSLLDQTARMLGVGPINSGGGINFTYAPTIYANNRAEIEPILQRHKEEIKQILEELLEGRVRVAYGY
ncbi:MAG: hypothetical protein DIU64_003105 [Caldicoprobacter oshimai]